MLKQELAPRGVGIPVLQGGEEVKERAMGESRYTPMAQSISGPVPAKLPPMPCGGTPLFDSDSGCAYRCDKCFAVIGSMGQPERCKEMNKDTQ